MTVQELLEEGKRRYPPGIVVYYDTNGGRHFVTPDHKVERWMYDSQLMLKSCEGLIYYNGKWASPPEFANGTTASITENYQIY